MQTCIPSSYFQFPEGYFVLQNYALTDSSCSSTMTYFSAQPDDICVPDGYGIATKSMYPTMNTFYNTDCSGQAEYNTTYSTICSVNDVNMNSQTNYKAVRTSGQATVTPSLAPSSGPPTIFTESPTPQPSFMPNVITSGYYISYNYFESGTCYGNSAFTGYALNTCVYIGYYYGIYTCNGGKSFVIICCSFEFVVYLSSVSLCFIQKL